jgi:hypothetical protein
MVIMRKPTVVAVTVLLAASFASAQGEKKFGWVRANDAIIQLDPADYRAGRVYHPGNEGGNIHVLIHSKLPVTVMMTWANEWNTAQAHPDMIPNLEYRCVREHVVEAAFECHLPPSQPMVIVLHDERKSNRAVLEGIAAIVGPGNAHRLVSPNDVKIAYHSWSCIENCREPEYRWSLLAKEKYDVSGAPKLYSLIPDYEGQRMWVKIKGKVPMTLAILPSKTADQAYSNPSTLSEALAQTTCKQRGVQAMEFECKATLDDGPQSLIVLPEGSVRSGKKVQIEFQTLKCVANCDLIEREMSAAN